MRRRKTLSFENSRNISPGQVGFCIGQYGRESTNIVDISQRSYEIFESC